MQPPAPTLIILCGTPHLDWDWLLPFSVLCNNQPPEQIDYFNLYPPNPPPVQDAFSIIQAGINFLCPNGQPNSAYFYSLCEMGFLQAFANANPDQVSLLQAAGSNLEILGGGITSPDNLLPHGEAFIRNYLQGYTWMNTLLGRTTRQAWLPDDFGHESQLPVLLAAMGFQGVAFWRVPGLSNNLKPLDGSPSVDQQLTSNGADFIWSARDGSTTVAHWLQNGYGQGGNLTVATAISCIQDYITANSPSSPTPTLFVPVGGDFAMPVDIPACAAAWNANPSTPSVKAQAGTFDQYIQAIAGSNLLQTQAFHPQPYYTGCFQTRPLLKRLHYETTRALLGAEIFTAIAGRQFNSISWQQEIQGRAVALQKAWNDLAPSTHHDYITGTGIHYVYYGEQAPRLAQVCDGAKGLRSGAMREIAAQITPQPQSGEQPLAVFNQLGFARSGLVETRPRPGGISFQSIRTPQGTFPVQASAEGGWLFFAGAQTLGYETCYLSRAAPQQAPQAVSITPSSDGSSYVLQNSLIEVGISGASNWSIDYIYDLQGPAPALNLLGNISNQLAFYLDQCGDNYRYGSENICHGSGNLGSLTLSPVAFENVTAQVLEAGPLRVRLLTRVSCTVDQTVYTYTREYMLVAGEPFLRMRTTGACPFKYSLMTQFTLGAPIATIAQGTTYHWDDAPLVRYWQGPSMQATHDFAIPENANGAPLGAIYHGSMPAWGQVEGAVLVGGLARNPGQNYFSWVNNVGCPPMGIDPDAHTLEYAFRVPTGITLTTTGVTDPSTGAQLMEALCYHTPLMAFPVPAATSKQLPASFSLASVAAGSGVSQPIITAAKPAESEPNDLILRIYQPSNSSMNAVLSLSGLQSLDGQQTLQVTPVTALEQPIAGATPLSGGAAGYPFTAGTALTTLRITQAEQGVNLTSGKTRQSYVRGQH
jgi:alpha-mannosidase